MFDEIQKLIAQGELIKAKTLLEQIHNNTPDNVRIIHLLATIYEKLELFNEAKIMFNKALEQAPNSAIIHNHYGLVLSRYDQPEEAVKQFKLALKLSPDYYDAMINLALTLHGQNKSEEAVACLLAVIKANYNNLRAHFFLAKIFLDEKLFTEANSEFEKIIAIETSDPGTLLSIIKSLLNYNRFHDVKVYYEKLLELQFNDVDILYNLAVIETKLGYTENAINHYHAILQIEPNNFATLNNIAVLYLEKRNTDTAKHYFQQALKLQPDNESIKYTLSAIEGDTTPDQAPQQYVKNLFDSYADHFEMHLRVGLQYRVPELLKENLAPFLEESKKHSLRILDLGCGTGICGELFQEYAKTLTGIDLSEKMIAQAKKKNCYDELIIAENIEYMQNNLNSFDLILAADVFVYIGNLEKTITSCFYALNTKGFLAFSTEICENKNFAMQPSGRFCHAKKYLCDLATRIGFNILVNKTCSTRLQGDQYAAGQIVILQKP